MVVRHTNDAGTAPGDLAGDGESYTGFGYLTGGTGSDSFVINNNSTLNAWLQPLTGNDSVLLDSGAVVTQFIQAQTYTYENTTYEIYNHSVAGLTPQQTKVNQHVGTGDSNDTITIDGSGYTGTEDYAISIGTVTASGDDLSTQGGNDNITITDGVHIAGGVSIGAGQDTLSIGPDVLIEGNISSAGGDGAADIVSIAEGATVTGGIELTNGDDTITIAGNLGNGGLNEQINGSEGANDITIASTAVLDIQQITMGSTTGSSLTVEGGAEVTLTPGSNTGPAIELTQGNDTLFLGGTFNSTYDLDVYENFVSDDSITLGADFSASNIGPNGIFRIHGGGNSATLDNDTLNISSLFPRIVTWLPDPLNAEHGTITLTDGTIIE